MLDLFKSELAKLPNETEVWLGYWELRELAKMCVGSESFMQACLERFKEYPIDVIATEIHESGLSEVPLLRLCELLRLREAAQTTPYYWTMIFSYFVGRKSARFGVKTSMRTLPSSSATTP